MCGCDVWFECDLFSFKPFLNTLDVVHGKKFDDAYYGAIKEFENK